MPTTPAAQQQAPPKPSSASDKTRQKQPPKPNQVDGANAFMDGEDNSAFNCEFEFDSSLSEEMAISPSIAITSAQHSVQGDTCHLPHFLLLSPSTTSSTKRKASRKLQQKQAASSVSVTESSASLCFEEEAGITSVGATSSGQSDWRIPQLDGPHGDSSSENEEEEESDEVCHFMFGFQV